jgi:MarC family membrane protein
MSNWYDFVHILTAFLVIANPIGAIPVFISLTETQSTSQRHHTALVTGASVIIVLILAVLLGESLLRFFGISLASFRVGGGILILMMAIAMMHARQGGARHTSEEAAEAEDKDSVGVIPLGIPLLAGPGAISTAIIYSHQSNNLLDTALILFSIAFLGILVWVALRLADPIGALLGRTGINIVTRVMGLLLAAISVEFIASGLKELFPILG